MQEGQKARCSGECVWIFGAVRVKRIRLTVSIRSNYKSDMQDSTGEVVNQRLRLLFSVPKQEAGKQFGGSFGKRFGGNEGASPRRGILSILFELQ